MKDTIFISITFSLARNSQQNCWNIERFASALFAPIAPDSPRKFLKLTRPIPREDRRLGNGLTSHTLGETAFAATSTRCTVFPG